MGSSEESGTNSKLKHVTKDVRESKIYPSEPYQNFSFIIKTKKYLDEEYALMKEIITSMTIFHSYMNFPSITTRVVHVYCFLSNPKLRKQNKVILIEFGPYYGFSEVCKEAPHYPLINGYRYIFTDGYFDNGYDGLAVVHKEMAFKKILEHFNSQKWSSRDYHSTKHNCQDFIKELIILLEAQLIHETIPIRLSWGHDDRYLGIYEIPAPLLFAFKRVLEKNGTKYSFELEIEGRIELFEYNLLRLIKSNKKLGNRVILIYEYEGSGFSDRKFKIYYKDFIAFYEDNELRGRKMASFFELFYLAFKNKQYDSKYKFY